MKKVTIDDLKNHLPEFQKNLGCEGEARILKEFIVPETFCEKKFIAAGSKLLFIYMGTDTEYSDTHHYLVWLENEGGMLVDMSAAPDNEILKNKDIILTEEGEIGYVVPLSVPAQMVIIWENNKPQAKSVITGAITELTDLLNKPLIETVLKFYSDGCFNIANLIFGNPNIIRSTSRSMEPYLSFMDASDYNVACLHDSFYLDMEKHGTRLRGVLISNPDASPQEIEKLISEL